MNLASKILLGVSSLLFVSALTIGLLGSHKAFLNKKCTGIDVVVLDGDRNSFLKEEDIVKVIEHDFGGYKNRYITDVNTDEIENILGRLSFIDDKQAYFTNDGMLHIEVSQKSPVAKIAILQGSTYYLDHNGEYFKISNDWCETIPSMAAPSGSASLLKNDRWRKGVAELCMHISNDKKISFTTKSLSCDKKGDICMEIEGRDEKFILGFPTDIEGKIKKVGKYLEEIAPALEAGKKYESVNLEYEGQIVCR